ncbi:hypothetical protein FY034_17375 (plasmid) [Trichlorobacter lovleyi]|uniref:hypothetical protein n=1 Tax=Trichlorobacter lovleyi TaxID=313985 RepID=UPI00223F62D3|nr:hypothetical protein [Trichlorobacter lovleyi]QOX80795.1 hypothetical protein FY034_17375 [Trichlorobacter lovleyi]
MKKLLTLGLSITTAFAVLLLSGCAGVTAKKDTPMASYNKLIVRSINWSETATDKISGDETKEFVAAQPKLQGMFKEEFSKYVQKLGYFENVEYSDSMSEANALILEPRIASLDPGIRWVMPGMATYMGVLKTSDGKVVAKYTAKRTVGRPVYSSMMGAIETLISELGEDAASNIHQATL